VAMPIGISMGDPAGIGPETVVRLFAEGTAVPCVVFGDAAALRRACAIVRADLAIHAVATPAEARCAPGRIDVVQVGGATDAIPFGRPDARAGAASVAYVLAGGRAALEGRTAALVTAPISKEAWAAAGVAHPGHTELLAEQAGVADFAMMLANDALRVVLVSIHVPLIEAVRTVTPEAEARAIRLAHAAARNLGIAHPRVAVAGLNPHAGENGHIGREDVEIIAPAIAAARAAGMDASGPWPGDTVFMRAREGAFDIVVAQYHDQGLIPIKYLGLADGVNVTLGLPYVRTSPDHGTAFDIAGTGAASAASMHAALRMALRLIGA
jgi:4-hydroxythreonine-4-phosphate dehydrogenase